MNLNSLTAISPIDGRYRSKVSDLERFFSEEALIRYRVLVEIEYFIALCEIPLPQLKTIDTTVFPALRKIYTDFSFDDALAVKEIEKVTNHDVKAVEYFIKEKFDDLGLSQYKEFIHFGLTSQDINNTAIPLSLKEALFEVYLPVLEELRQTLQNLASEWDSVPMLARTHGQPASPTILGKEIRVFVTRIDEQLKSLKKYPACSKVWRCYRKLQCSSCRLPIY
jgi:adenylosuccinate lyase